MADVKKILGEVLEKAKKAKQEEDAERQKRNDSDRTAVLQNLSGDLSKSLQAIMPELVKSAQVSEETIRKALSEAIQINMPQLEMPEIEIPDIHVDTTELNAVASRIEQAIASLNLKETVVNLPESNFQFPERVNVTLPDYDKTRPMPVMMMDDKGRPFNFPQSNIGGGKADFLTIKDIRNSSGGSIIDNDGFMKVTGSFTVSAAGASNVALVNSDGTYYNSDNPLPVTFSAASVQPVSQVSGAAWSVSVTDIYGTVATNLINPDGRMKVELPTGSSGLTDTELRATSLTVQQLSGANFSVSVTDIFGSTGTGFYNLDNRLRVSNDVTDVFVTTTTSSVVNADNRVKVELPAMTITAVTSITNTIAAANVDSSGVQYSGSNPMPVTLAVSNATSTLNAVIVDSSGIGYNGANPVPVTVTGITGTTSSGYTRQTNPTAVASDYVPLALDDLGRQLTRPLQVRDLIKTAYVSLATGTETTLISAVAGAYLDLIMIVASNNSDAAVSVDIRPVTGGNIVNTLRIPANGTAGWTPAVPWPQTDTGNNWTVDGPDETGRTLTFSALFSQEI
jgi:hypothetical protein